MHALLNPTTHHLALRNSQPLHLDLNLAMARLSTLRRHAIDRKLTDQVLSNERYPLLYRCSNSMIKKIFGCCSKQHHKLEVLVQNHEYGVAWLDEWTDDEADWQGCLAFERSAGPSYRRTLSGVCPKCYEYIGATIMGSRLIAIFQLPVEEIWKGVLTRRGYPTIYVFEGSGRCNRFGHPNHCMTVSHWVLETFVHDTKRKSHHTGVRSCNCVRSCIGVNVRLRMDKPQPSRISHKNDAGTLPSDLHADSCNPM